VQVERLVARCDHVTYDEYAAELQRVPREDTGAELARFDEAVHFSVHELAVLADGREVLVGERGWSSTPHGMSVEELWAHLDEQGLTETVLSVVLPDDDEPEEEHPYDELAQALVEQGVEVTAEDLRGVPYEVELSERLRHRLGGG
jgi:hypothetical protein